MRRCDEHSERRCAMTNHGAELESRPLRERWEMTPVMIRADIAAHGERVRAAAAADLTGSDLLAQAMHFLSLNTAKFGGIGEESELVDQLVKRCVKNHHRTWIMRPLEKLYDELMAKEVAL